MGAYAMGEIMDLACRAGKIILENGGEIYRVEDTMLYIGRAYGLRGCECYATPTSIMLSAMDADCQAHTRMMRIHARGVNLRKLEAVNNLSREIIQCPMTPEQAESRLQDIEAAPAYSLWLLVLASALGTGAFTVVLGGGFDYFLYGLCIGALLRLLITALERLKLNSFTVNLVGGAVAALGGWLLTSLGLLTQWWFITLASLMLLVPGLLLTNALRDTVAGDLISGISRGIEALSIAAALAFGAAATHIFLMRLGG